MKSILTFLLVLFISITVNCQSLTKPLQISTNGVGDIKIGMTKPQVEKIIKIFRPYTTPDSILKKQDTAMLNKLCKECSENLLCNYKDVEFLLTFFRNTSNRKADLELVGISPTSTLPVVEVKGGIKAGITEKEFIKICKKNKYKYNFYSYNVLMDLQKKGCFFTDNLIANKETAKTLMIIFSKGIATSLSVVNMIGN